MLEERVSSPVNGDDLFFAPALPAPAQRYNFITCSEPADIACPRLR